MMHSLSSLGRRPVGAGSREPGATDLDQARLAIDAFRALLGVLEGKRPAEEITAHRSVFPNCRWPMWLRSDGNRPPGNQRPTVNPPPTVKRRKTTRTATGARLTRRFSEGSGGAGGGSDAP